MHVWQNLVDFLSRLDPSVIMNGCSAFCPAHASGPAVLIICRCLKPLVSLTGHVLGRADS